MTQSATETDRCPECSEEIGVEPLSGKRVCLRCETSYTRAELDGVATDGGKRSSIDMGGRTAEVQYGSMSRFIPFSAGWIR